MSYILEALKMSEQSRRQGAPTSQYSLLPPVLAEESPAGRFWRHPLLLGALLVNAAIIAVWLRPTGPAVTSTAPAAALPAPLAPPAAAPAPLPPLVRQAPISTPPVALVKIPPTPSSPPQPPRAPAAVAAVKAPAPPPAEPAADKEKEGQPKAPVATAKAEATPEPMSTTGLPVSIQKQLPPLVVAGVIHDDDANSLVIVNDKLMHEGDEVAPGLKLEKILDDGAVFTYKGYRFKR